MLYNQFLFYNLFYFYNQFLNLDHCSLFYLPLPLSVPSAEGMNAGGYGNLLMNSEQPQGEYGVTVAFLRLVTTLVKVPSDQIILEQLPCYLLL